jgi:hypothetical protein
VASKDDVGALLEEARMRSDVVGYLLAVIESRSARPPSFPSDPTPRGCPRSHAHSSARSRQHHLGGRFLDPWTEVDSFGNLLSSTQQLVAPAHEVKTFDSEKGEFSVYKKLSRTIIGSCDLKKQKNNLQTLEFALLT